MWTRRRFVQMIALALPRESRVDALQHLQQANATLHALTQRQLTLYRACDAV